MNLFSTSKQPKEKTLYTITNGTYKGLTILFFELNKMPKNNEYITLAFSEQDEYYGGMSIFNIPKNAVIEGFKKKIIEKIGKIPTDVNNLFYKEYKERIKLKDKKS